MSGKKVIRGVIGIVVVFALFFLVLNWVGDYRSASKKPVVPAKNTSSKTSTSTDADGKGSTPQEAVVEEQPADGGDTAIGALIVEVDGLNFRKQPSGDSPAVRGLKKGERVDILEDLGDWYKVRDGNGEVGYITSNQSYTRSIK